MSYQIMAGENLEDTVYKPIGGCADFFYCKEHEFVASGPAETGKTLAACWKMHFLALKYPGLNGAIVRKSQRSVYGSVLQTFARVIKGAPVSAYGGESPDKYIYENGSVIWVGGMDNPDKILSSERDFIYVNQAEELKLDDWEKITTRTTGRGAVMPYTMAFGDCNPGGSKHWIREREKQGALRIINTTHKDNPTLYDADGKLTAQGQRSLNKLAELTGVRRKRLFEGLWATAEGAVYDEFDSAVHVRTQTKTYDYALLAMDEGYTNPAVILVVLVDNDGRMHVIQEFYERGILQAGVCERAKQLAMQYNTNTAIVDAAAAGLIAELNNVGLNAIGHKGRVLDGISIVQSLLKVKGDGLPRLTVDPSCINTINEFESYAWKTGKDEPVKEFDHAADALRYLSHWLYADEMKSYEVVYQPARIGEGW